MQDGLILIRQIRANSKDYWVFRAKNWEEAADRAREDGTQFSYYSQTPQEFETCWGDEIQESELLQQALDIAQKHGKVFYVSTSDDNGQYFSPDNVPSYQAFVSDWLDYDGRDYTILQNAEEAREWLSKKYSEILSYGGNPENHNVFTDVRHEAEMLDWISNNEYRQHEAEHEE